MNSRCVLFTLSTLRYSDIIEYKGRGVFMSKIQKWHIGPNGIPAICTATKRACPYGSASGHFDTQAEAAAESDRMLMAKYGISYDGDYSETIAESKTLKSLTWVQATYKDDSSGVAPIDGILSTLRGRRATNNAGDKYEAYGALAYAQDLGLSNSYVMGDDGDAIYSELSQAEADEAADNAVKNAYAKINSHLASKGIDNKNGDSYIRTVHFSDDGETIVAHMGGNSEGVLDIAVIKGNNVDIVEFKRAQGGGAQISSSTLTVDKDGSPVVSDSGVNDRLKRQISRHGFSSTFGTNLPVNITQRESLEYMVDSYKAKGATKFSYLNRKNEVVEVDISGTTAEAVRRLEENNIKATVKLRSNMLSSKPTDVDKERWRTKRNEYFKSNETPKPGETFTLNDVKGKYKRNITESVGGYATIGEMVLPIKAKDIRNYGDDTPISFDKLKVRTLTLIGEVKEVAPSKLKQAS